jgi:hypothetical protein
MTKDPKQELTKAETSALLTVRTLSRDWRIARMPPPAIAALVFTVFRVSMLSPAPREAVELPPLSSRSLTVARSISMEPLVTSYLKLGCREPARIAPGDTDQCFTMRQQITERLLLASLEVSAVAALLDSEEERADQAANILAERERSLTTKLTSIAIGVGAGGAVAVGLSGREEIAIATGAAEAVLGVMLLRAKKKVQFTHPKNPLRDFWFGRRQASSFPASLWAYFEETPSEANPALNVRDGLMRTWGELYGFNDGSSKPGSKTAALLFGSGGVYTKDDLRLRADLLDQLEALVSRMHEELRTLLAELTVSLR